MPNPPAPRTPLERELEKVQAKIAQGDLARARRTSIVAELAELGMPHADIAARLDRADRRHGGTGVTLAAVQKIASRAKGAA